MCVYLARVAGPVGWTAGSRPLSGRMETCSGHCWWSSVGGCPASGGRRPPPPGWTPSSSAWRESLRKTTHTQSAVVSYYPVLYFCDIFWLKCVCVCVCMCVCARAHADPAPSCSAAEHWWCLGARCRSCRPPAGRRPCHPISSAASTSYSSPHFYSGGLAPRTPTMHLGKGRWSVVRT